MYTCTNCTHEPCLGGRLVSKYSLPSGCGLLGVKKPTMEKSCLSKEKNGFPQNREQRMSSNCNLKSLSCYTFLISGQLRISFKKRREILGTFQNLESDKLGSNYIRHCNAKLLFPEICSKFQRLR